MGSVAEYWVVRTFAPHLNLVNPSLIQEYDYHYMGEVNFKDYTYPVHIVPKVEWDLWAYLWSEEHLYRDYLEEVKALVEWLHGMNEEQRDATVEHIAEKLGFRRGFLSDFV